VAQLVQAVITGTGTPLFKTKTKHLFLEILSTKNAVKTKTKKNAALQVSKYL
jgi:hypothetical protein